MAEQHTDPHYFYYKGQSLQSRLIYTALKISRIKRLLGRQTKSDMIRKANVPAPPAELYKQFDISTEASLGSNVYTLSPKEGASGKCVIFLHGGAYVMSFSRFHWTFIAKLIKQTGCTVIVPDYPLSPEYTYKERFEMMEPVYKDVITRWGAKNVVLMGDSAGGNFALALAKKMKAENVPQRSKLY